MTALKANRYLFLIHVPIPALDSAGTCTVGGMGAKRAGKEKRVHREEKKVPGEEKKVPGKRVECSEKRREYTGKRRKCPEKRREPEMKREFQ